MRFTDYGPGYSGIEEANREARGCTSQPPLRLAERW